MIYGLEANLVDDGVPIAYNPVHRLLEEDICRVRRRDDRAVGRL